MPPSTPPHPTPPLHDLREHTLAKNVRLRARFSVRWRKHETTSQLFWLNIIEYHIFIHIPPSKCLKLNLIHQLEKDTRWVCLKMWFSNKSPGANGFFPIRMPFSCPGPRSRATKTHHARCRSSARMTHQQILHSLKAEHGIQGAAPKKKEWLVNGPSFMVDNGRYICS